MKADWFSALASTYGERPALYWGGRWFSYQALYQRAQRLAGWLHQAGVQPGDRVGLLSANHIAHFDTLFAAPLLGVIAVPFNFRLAATEQQALLADIAPSVLITSQSCRLALPPGCRYLWLEDYETALANAPPPPAAPALSVEQPQCLLFTGGSTGRPKGALLSYQQLMINATSTVQHWGINSWDCVIHATPCFHAGLHVLATPLLYAGGRVVLHSSFDTASYWQALAQHHATLLFMVPTMFQMLTEDPAFASAPLQQVRWAISGGAPCLPAVQAAWLARGVAFRQGYGLTEAGVNCFTQTAAEGQARPHSVGYPMPPLQARLMLANGQLARPGEVGELQLSGPQVFLGYYQRPAETAASFQNGWLRTGDLACRDEAGRYRITGRSKEMYISGGENVYPAEVETALLALPGIREAAVVGVPHPRWGETGLAALAPHPGYTLDTAAIQLELRERLSGYKLPSHYLLLAELPKTGTDKINKPAILQNWQASQ